MGGLPTKFGPPGCSTALVLGLLRAKIRPLEALSLPPTALLLGARILKIKWTPAPYNDLKNLRQGAFRRFYPYIIHNTNIAQASR